MAGLKLISSNDPAIVAQHMTWLRQASVGVIITSWWGQGSSEDQVVTLLLQMAECSEIKVAFHIEPYGGRTAESLISDIQYLYKRYGSNPAFFRSTATSRYSPDDQPKGMFFVWSIEVPESGQDPVEASYWEQAMESIHALPGDSLIIANTLQSRWIDRGHIGSTQVTIYNNTGSTPMELQTFEWDRVTTDRNSDQFPIPSNTLIENLSP